MYKDKRNVETKCIKNVSGVRVYLLRVKVEEKFLYVAAFIDIKKVAIFGVDSCINLDGMEINPYSAENAKDLSGYFIRKPQKITEILQGGGVKIYTYNKYIRQDNEVIGNVTFIRYVFERVLANADLVQVIYFN